jgi:uncharacterized protein (TIGR00375 family)
MDKINLDFNEILFADFHIHSRFSQACSKNITFENLVKWARIKGIDLLGTGDFTHPLWFKEIKDKLVDNGKGIYYYQGFPFIITGEISFMYSQDGKGRRIHLNLLIPNIEIAEKIQNYLDTKGRRDYDGRPIFNISCEEFTREMKKISKDIEIIPAHIWTPWFGIFGSKSGFDSLKQAFGSEFKNIFAIETGISSDPVMNWRIKELIENNISIVSFSDAHSYWPFRLGREATIFKKTDSYNEIIKQIRENDFFGTIEAEPAYGKYHWDGHRNCGFSCSSNEAKKINYICPVCKKLLTRGVEDRVEELAENSENFKPKNAKIFYKILPLNELIVLVYGGTLQSKKNWEIYHSLINLFGNEFNILLKITREELIKANIDNRLINLILKNREGKIKIKPGYDGVYGKAVLEKNQKTLI